MKPGLATISMWALGTAPLAAQTFTVESVNPWAVDLGAMVSAGSGDTIFRISASDGSVSKQGGQGTRQGTGSGRALITVRCSESDDCETSEATVTISTTGSPTGRAAALSGFTVAAGPNPPILGSATGSDSLTFTVSGIPRDQTREFYLGADFTLTASGATGAASTAFLVSVGSSARSGSISALAWRSITLANLSAMSFGRIIPPATGTATILLDATNGARSISSGAAVALPTPNPSTAQFRVSGEGGESFAIEIPESFQLIGPSGELTVTTNDNTAGSAIVDGMQGAEGTHDFNVGGSLSLPAGTSAGVYSGTFVVSVHYN